MKYLTLLIGFFIPMVITSWGAEIKYPQLTTGNSTTLFIEYIGGRVHEKTLGKTIIRLTASKSGEALFNKQEKGVFVCLGFNKATGDFIIGKAIGEREVLPVAVFFYLNEQTGAWRTSQPGLNDLRVYSSQCSPNGAFIAYIGNVKTAENGVKLIILNTNIEEFRVLGEAPAPPPEDKGTCNLWKERELEDEWGWDFPFNEGYILMEPGILTFPDDETLQVSYGEDTCRRRAAIRTVKQWKLNSLF